MHLNALAMWWIAGPVAEPEERLRTGEPEASAGRRSGGAVRLARDEASAAPPGCYAQAAVGHGAAAVSEFPMPRTRRHLIALLPLALTAACSTGSPEEFDRRIATYVGRPEADVVAGLGIPSRAYDGDGRRLLQYDFARPSSIPAILPSIGLGFGSGGWGSGFGIGTGLGFGFGGYGAPAATCVLVFESRDGRITGFNRNGPGCVAPAA